MGLFDFLKGKQSPPPVVKKTQNEQPTTIKQMADYSRAQKSNDKSLDHRNFIDDLVGSFKSQEQVIDASFGYVQFQNSNQPNLFLSIGLTGEEESIKSMTWFIKSMYFPETTLHFASNLTNTEVYEYIQSGTFSFYDKHKEQTLEQKIMKNWFEPEKFKNELVQTIKGSKVITLLKDFNENSNLIDFQTYVRDGKEFIPLFSDREMITKSGMIDIPSNLTIVGFDFKKINEILSGGLNSKFFVLNPGTTFEVEFNA